MKVTLRFTLPEDEAQYNQYSKAPDMAYALWDIAHNLKKECIRLIEADANGGLAYDAYDGVEVVFTQIYNILEQHNINTDELM
jgi:pantothenate kinase